MKKQNKKPSVVWCLPNSKKPFAYSTVAESDSIRDLLMDYKDLRLIPTDTILSEKERFIIDAFMENSIFAPKVR